MSIIFTLKPFKGRLITKVTGGEGGEFLSCTNFFGKTSCTIFFSWENVWKVNDWIFFLVYCLYMNLFSRIVVSALDSESRGPRSRPGRVIV